MDKTSFMSVDIDFCLFNLDETLLGTNGMECYRGFTALALPESCVLIVSTTVRCGLR